MLNLWEEETHRRELLQEEYGDHQCQCSAAGDRGLEGGLD